MEAPDEIGFGAADDAELELPSVVVAAGTARHLHISDRSLTVYTGSTDDFGFFALIDRFNAK